MNCSSRCAEVVIVEGLVAFVSAGNVFRAWRIVQLCRVFPKLPDVANQREDRARPCDVDSAQNRARQAV